MKAGALERLAVPTPVVTPVVLLLSEVMMIHTLSEPTSGKL
jgi:hypothetical protein